eukprot:1186452-Prorocentrum_minimum.AAC.3
MRVPDGESESRQPRKGGGDGHGVHGKVLCRAQRRHLRVQRGQPCSPAPTRQRAVNKRRKH